MENGRRGGNFAAARDCCCSGFLSSVCSLLWIFLIGPESPPEPFSRTHKLKELWRREERAGGEVHNLFRRGGGAVHAMGKGERVVEIFWKAGILSMRMRRNQKM